MTVADQWSAALDRGLARVPRAILLLIECVALFAVLAVAWRERSALPPVPISDPDTWGYLRPALSCLSGLGFLQTDGRDWLYPALVALFLKTSGSFAGIVVRQKVLGICSGLLMALTWRGWVSTLPFRRWVLFPATLCGALPIFIQLMNQQSIFFEMSIRPEGVLSFFVYAQLACLMGYYKYRWQTPKTLLSWIFGAAAVVLSYACFLLKPSWLLGFVFTAAPVFLGVFGRALPLKARLLAPALGIVLSLLILWLPAKFFLTRDSQSVTLLPDALFAVHARLIDKTLHTRLAALSDADPEKAKLQALLTVLESDLQIAEGRHAYRTLGFDADYLMHSQALTDAIYHYTGHDDGKFRAFCISCYLDAAFHQPLAFGRKIYLQFSRFLFSEPGIFFKDHTDFARPYKDAEIILVTNFPPDFRPSVAEMYRHYEEDVAARAGAGLRLDKKPQLRNFREAFARLVLPVEILFLLAFAAALAWPPLRAMRLGGWAALSLFSAPLGNALTVCIVHALDVTRYRVTYGGFLLFTTMAMGLFVCLIIARSLLHAVEKRSIARS